MEQTYFPHTVLLHRSGNPYYSQLKRLLENWGIEIFEVSVLAEIKDKAILESIHLALSIVDGNDVSGIDFLRSVMHSNTWIQRIMLMPEANMEIYERAVNKAHINYMLQIPLPGSKLETYLRKAVRRFENITKPFAKFDALSSVTEELLVENEKFRMEATLDPMTKLMNRRSFNKILERVWQRYKEKGIPFSIALFDIDHFKKVNDTYGHQAGDRVLERIAEIMIENQRLGIDYSFRYGGEEFVVLSSNTNGMEMKRYLERLLRLVSRTKISYESHEISVTFSAGVCEASQSESPESLIGKADAAMYKAKENGRALVLQCPDKNG